MPLPVLLKIQSTGKKQNHTWIRPFFLAFQIALDWPIKDGSQRNILLILTNQLSIIGHILTRLEAEFG
jgi:hypothetical protein